jgi:hypothetical protein
MPSKPRVAGSIPAGRATRFASGFARQARGRRRLRLTPTDSCRARHFPKEFADSRSFTNRAPCQKRWFAKKVTGLASLRHISRVFDFALSLSNSNALDRRVLAAQFQTRRDPRPWIPKMTELRLRLPDAIVCSSWRPRNLRSDATCPSASLHVALFLRVVRSQLGHRSGDICE